MKAKISFKRIGAYIVDCLILFVVLLIVGMFIPTFGDARELSERLTSISDDYFNEKIDAKEYVEAANDVNYDISKATYLSSITGIVVYILYFVVFQAYNNGQTLGKKLFKIRVVKTDGSSLDINTLIKRCLIPYGILVNIVLLIMLLVTSKSVYISINGILSNIHLFIIAISIVMVFANNRGAHDYLAGTTVEEL